MSQPKEPQSTSSSTTAPASIPTPSSPSPSIPSITTTTITTNQPVPSTTNPSTTSTSTSIPLEDAAQRTAEARTAFTASLHSVGANLDADLRARATDLHHNAAALAKQEADLNKATADLARRNDDWHKIAETARQGLKEIGDVQNWAEIIERDLLVVEETLRLVEGKAGDDSGDYGEWEGEEEQQQQEQEGDGVNGLASSSVVAGKKANSSEDASVQGQGNAGASGSVLQEDAGKKTAGGFWRRWW